MTELSPDARYRAFLEEGWFMLQRSSETGAFFFYPRVAEPGTGCRDLEWVPASGRGVVHAVTVVRSRPPAADYNVVLVDLAEGCRMMSRVEGVDPEAVRIGMPVRARIAQSEEGPFIVFDPEHAA